MPSERTPRSFAGAMARPSGSVPPGRMNGYECPAATFGAPHTT